MENIFAEEFCKVKLTKSQKKIAQYCMDNQFQVCQKTLHEFAEEAGVSEVSVLNFVRKLGYDGFSEFKAEIYSRMMECVNHQEPYSRALEERLRSNRQERTQDTLLEDYLKIAVGNVESSLLQNKQKSFEDIVNWFLHAPRIYVVGMRSLNGVAERLFYGLNYLLDGVAFVHGDPYNLFQLISSAERESVLYLICLPRFCHSDVEICKMAKERGMKLVLLSDTPLSPLAVYADYLLTAEIKSISFFNSMAGLNAIHEYLCAMIAERIGDKASDRWKMIDKYMADFRF